MVTLAGPDVSPFGLKALRETIGALMMTYDEVSFWLPLGPGELRVRLKDGRTIRVVVRFDFGEDES